MFRFGSLNNQLQTLVDGESSCTKKARTPLVGQVDMEISWIAVKVMPPASLMRYPVVHTGVVTSCYKTRPPSQILANLAVCPKGMQIDAFELQGALSQLIMTLSSQLPFPSMEI